MMSVVQCGKLPKAETFKGLKLKERVYKKNNSFPRNRIQKGTMSASTWTLRELTTSLGDSGYKPVLCLVLWF